MDRHYQKHYRKYSPSPRNSYNRYYRNDRYHNYNTIGRKDYYDNYDKSYNYEKYSHNNYNSRYFILFDLILQKQIL